MIIAEKISDFFHGLPQDFDAGQVDHAEVIRLFPVKTASMDEQDLFVPQKIQSESLIVGDVELFHV